MCITKYKISAHSCSFQFPEVDLGEKVAGGVELIGVKESFVPSLETRDGRVKMM